MLVFYIGDNILTKYNIQFSIHKFIILVLCCMFFSKIKNIGSEYFPQAIKLLIFIGLYTLFKVFTGGSAGNTNMGDHSSTSSIYIPCICFNNKVFGYTLL